MVDQARALGTRQWAISGGEPMLRDDFAELFDYVTAKATAWTLNTNGTLITPETARLLRRKGGKMVAVYGATAEVYDHVTRSPGGFEALLQGLHYLKEAGAGFIVQLIPMRDNWRQWDEMIAFAKQWSPHWRVGAPWLYKSACGDERRNAEIERQRLEAAEVVDLDWPDMGAGGGDMEGEEQGGAHPQPATGDDRLYAACIAARRDVHVDPYGGLSFCGFVTDPALRYDLRSGASVAAATAAGRDAPEGGGVIGAAAAAGRDARECGGLVEAAAGGMPTGAAAGGIPPGAVRAAWDEFIPALADVVRGGEEYREGCAVCELRDECRWCDVYGYLEHGRHGARVEHLCAVARETAAFKDTWTRDHRRFFEIAGITVQVESDLPFAADTFDPKFASFSRDRAGSSDREGARGDTVVLRHHFSLPYEESRGDGYESGGVHWQEVYRRPPWAIYRAGTRWIYEGISPDADDPSLHRVASFNAEHTRGELYDPPHYEEIWRSGGLGSLSLFPSDQIWLARVLADREACYLHSGAVALTDENGGRHGLLFVGHSDAGKSTTMKLLQDALGERVEILCDDRNIVRRWEEKGFWVHGTWSHGDVSEVSGEGAPLRAILFLEQSPANELVRLTDRMEVWRRLLATLIRPVVTGAWWQKSMDVLERVVEEVPCYTMRFDRSGAIVPRLEELAR